MTTPGRGDDAGMREESGAVTGEGGGRSVIVYSAGRGTIFGSEWRRYDKAAIKKDYIRQQRVTMMTK